MHLLTGYKLESTFFLSLFRPIFSEKRLREQATFVSLIICEHVILCVFFRKSLSEYFEICAQDVKIAVCNVCKVELMPDNATNMCKAMQDAHLPNLPCMAQCN